MELLLALLLFQQPAETAHCTVESPTRLLCKVTGESAPAATGELPVGWHSDSKPFTIRVGPRHKWREHLRDLRHGVSTVELERRGRQLCLVSVQREGGWVRHPVNARLNVCVKR